MTEAANKWIDGLMGRLSLEQKVGQLMVFGFMGPVINPNVIELITKYHAGGLRIAIKVKLIDRTGIAGFMPGSAQANQTFHQGGQTRI